VLYDLRLVLAGVRKELDAGTSSLVGAMRNLLLQKKVRIERMEMALELCRP